MEKAQRDRVVIIDDQVSYVDALGLALSITDDLELVDRASDGVSALEACRQAEPDLVVCDYRLPDGETGADVAISLRSSGVNVPIIILTGFLAPQVQREADALVDVAALSKDTSIDELVSAMRLTIAGRGLPSAPSVEVSETGLSAGELEVLEALNQGASPAEIADSLHFSLHTIRARIKSVHRKLEVGSQGEAIATATRLGLLVPPG